MPRLQISFVRLPTLQPCSLATLLPDTRHESRLQRTLRCKHDVVRVDAFCGVQSLSPRRYDGFDLVHFALHTSHVRRIRQRQQQHDKAANDLGRLATSTLSCTIRLQGSSSMMHTWTYCGLFCIPFNLGVLRNKIIIFKIQWKTQFDLEGYKKNLNMFPGRRVLLNESDFSAFQNNFCHTKHRE